MLCMPHTPLEVIPDCMPRSNAWECQARPKIKPKMLEQLSKNSKPVRGSLKRQLKLKSLVGKKTDTQILK